MILWHDDLVVVEGVSRHGKNRISEHGKVWKVKTIDLTYGILLEANDNYLKWVRNDVDPDFKILKIINPHVL